MLHPIFFMTLSIIKKVCLSLPTTDAANHRHISKSVFMKCSGTQRKTMCPNKDTFIINTCRDIFQPHIQRNKQSLDPILRNCHRYVHAIPVLEFWIILIRVRWKNVARCLHSVSALYGIFLSARASRHV